MYYKQTFNVRWADVDPNLHMRHTAYADYSAHVRIACLSENGFPFERMMELGMGPIVFREETLYKKEVRLNENITVDFCLAGFSTDGRKYKIVHHIRKADDQIAAFHSVEGSWMNLQKRKLTVPPEELFKIMSQLEKTEDFCEL